MTIPFAAPAAPPPHAATPNSPTDSSFSQEEKVPAPTVVPVAQPAPEAGGPADHTSLKKVITTRQFVPMALGGSIGAGLLIASSVGLQRGGPASLVLAFAIAGFAVWLTMCALGELSASFPVQGSFYDYSIRFISKSWGFSMGWNYVINFVLIIPFETTVMILITQYWYSPNTGWFVPIVLACLFGIASAGAKWYAEAEHAFGLAKVGVLVLFIITAIIICAGGVPSDPRHGTGFSYWQNGGAFQNGVSGFLWVFVNAGLAYGGTEILGMTVAECQNPTKVMPLASKIVGGRIIVLYVLTLLMAGLVIGPDTFELFPDMRKTSPFVLAIHQAGIPGLASFVNAVILISVFSMANASVFASSRALRAICAQGMGPRILSHTTKKKRLPRNALIVVFVVSLLAFINAAPKGDEIFEWLLALASASNYFTWLSICLAHLRMRAAMKKQGKDLSQLTWRSPVGTWGSVVAICIFAFALVSQIISAVIPPVPNHDEGPAQSILRGILGFIVVIAAWVGHLVWTRSPLLIPLKEADLTMNTDVPDANGSAGC
ncbi:amino acid permease [Apiospora arundinis]|uniref:Amino acid permease n=1 Tax=Apiospora arundinis TaxID=335852 RepID=A0ABR2I8X1_9PEZI